MLSDKELMQISGAVNKVLEARLMEFSEVQLTIVSDMLISMTDKYVEALMQLTRLMGIPKDAGRKEADRMAALMLEGLQK